MGSALFDQEAVNLEDDKKNGVARTNSNDPNAEFEEMMRAQPGKDSILDEFE